MYLYLLTSAVNYLHSGEASQAALALVSTAGSFGCSALYLAIKSFIALFLLATALL